MELTIKKGPVTKSEREAVINRYAQYDQKTFLLIEHYESRIRGEEKNPYPKYLFEEKNSIDGSHNPNANAINRTRVLALFRYVFEELLNWSPEDAANNLNAEVCGILDLNKPLAQLAADFKEVGCSIQSDHFYVAKLCYPDRLKNYNLRQSVINTYQAVLRSKNGAHFSTIFFADGNASLKASICLMYALSTNVRFRSVWDMYCFFADDKKSHEFFKEWRLETPARNFQNPLAYLHNSLTSSQKSQLYYNILTVNKILKACDISGSMKVIEEG